VRLLRRAWAGGRLAQAYCFSGPTGVGKRSTAVALAQAVNCLSPVGAPSGEDTPTRAGRAAPAHGSPPAGIPM
jgi:DNA polymerase III subunit gamma/tau